jgi:serpin B
MVEIETHPANRGSGMRLVLIAAVVLALVHGASVPCSAQPLSPERVLGAQMRLSTRLASELEKQSSSPNIVISPASIAGVMALLDIGVDTKMRGAIWDMLGFKAALGHDAKSDLKALRTTITQAPLSPNADAKFNIANAVLIDPVAKPYARAIDEMRGTGAEVSVGQLSDPANIKQINAWVAKKTENLIPSILPEQPLPPGLVAVNALYFKGLWPKAFVKELTTQQPFHTVSSDIETPMMQRVGTYHFRRDGDFAAIEMPYRGDRYALVLVTNTARSLPFSDFTKVSTWLDASGFSRREIDLSLPRFTLEGGEELLDPLKKIGLGNGMDSVTAFEGLSAIPQEISRVVQKTYLRVDEEGTEAAAATGVVVATESIRREPEKLAFDRPFLFALRDRHTGLILMSGYIGKPFTGPAADRGAPNQLASEKKPRSNQ